MEGDRWSRAGVPARGWHDEAVTGSRRRWVYALVAGWALLLAGIAFLPVASGDATVLEHRSPVRAQPVVDRGVAAAVSAAGPDIAVAVTDYRLRQRCEIAQFREGGDFARIAYLHTAPGTEKALLQRLADSFGERHDVRGPLRDGSFSVGLAEFVTLRAAPTGGESEDRADAGTGVVQVTVSTGCRPIDAPVATFRAMPTTDDYAHFSPMLLALGVTTGTWATHQATCDGGTIRTVEFSTPAGDSGPLTRLAPSPSARRPAIVSRPDLVAYRDGATSVVARRTGDTVTVLSTVDCAG